MISLLYLFIKYNNVSCDYMPLPQKNSTQILKIKFEIKIIFFCESSAHQHKNLHAVLQINIITLLIN